MKKTTIQKTKRDENYDNCIHCYKCGLQCREEWEMIRHITREHVKDLIVDMCWNCFGTNYLVNKFLETCLPLETR